MAPVDIVGALCFGIIVGWVTYRTLRRSQTTGLSDIATVIAAVGGGAVTAIWKGELFSWYCIGLFVGFFGYLIIAIGLNKQDTLQWMGGEDSTSGGGQRPPGS